MLEPAAEPLIPPAALATGIACVAGAVALANCAVLAVLLRRTQHGLYSLIAHLSAADLMLLVSSIAPELWSTNSRSWPFGSSGCVAYQGLNVFTSTASQYLVVAIALHSLATSALEERAFERRLKKTADDNELRCSQRSLVACSDSSTPPRTMNVDYQLERSTVPVTLPAIFVWFLAASLSIPEFLLAFTVKGENQTLMCTIDSNHSVNIRFLLTVFDLILPLFLLSTASALIIEKLRSRKCKISTNSDLLAALKWSICLAAVHFMMCIPRSMAGAYRAYVESIAEHMNPWKSSHHHDFIVGLNLAFSGAYMIATLVRPLGCIILMPQIRNALF